MFCVKRCDVLPINPSITLIVTSTWLGPEKAGHLQELVDAQAQLASPLFSEKEPRPERAGAVDDHFFVAEMDLPADRVSGDVEYVFSLLVPLGGSFKR